MNEQAAWDIYYAQLVSWSLHPGYVRPEVNALTLVECAALADKMLKEREVRWPQ